MKFYPDLFKGRINAKWAMGTRLSCLMVARNRIFSVLSFQNGKKVNGTVTSDLLLPGCVRSCPACPHRMLTMEESLSRKWEFIASRLSSYRDLLSPVRSVPEGERYHYRDKVCLSCEYVENQWHIGVRSRGKVISIPDCPVHSQRVNQVHRFFLGNLPGYKDFPLIYLVSSGAQLALVMKSGRFPEISWLRAAYEDVLEQSGVEGLWVHLHPSAGKKVFGKGNWTLVAGRPVSEDEDGLVYGPAAFQQLLPGLYYEALETACHFMNPFAGSLVVDLYSGTGSSIRYWRRDGALVMGVEVSGEALEHALVNVPGIQVLRGTCRQRIPQLESWVRAHSSATTPRLLYVNPPRTGLETEVGVWITDNLRPDRMAYLSCSPGTLRRDLDYLLSKGWVPRQLLPYDFFPQTRHIEVLSLLEHKE